MTDEEMQKALRLARLPASTPCPSGTEGLDTEELLGLFQYALLALAAENTALRSHPPLSAEERESLERIRVCIVEREGDYVMDMRGAELSRGLALLDRLLAASETQGESK